MRISYILGTALFMCSAMAARANLLPQFVVDTHYSTDAGIHDLSLTEASPLAIQEGMTGLDLKARSFLSPGNIPSVGTFVSITGANLNTEPTAHALATVYWTVTSDTLPLGTPITAIYNLHIGGQLRSDSPRYATSIIDFQAYDGPDSLMRFHENANLHGNAEGNWAWVSDYAGTNGPSFGSPDENATFANADSNRNLYLSMKVGSTYALSVELTSSVSIGDFTAAITRSDMYNTVSYQYLNATMDDGNGGTVAAPISMIAAVPEPATISLMIAAAGLLAIRRRNR
jgi:hypothetical protein